MDMKQLCTRARWPLAALFVAVASSACSERSALAEAARTLTAIESGAPVTLPTVPLLDTNGDPYVIGDELEGRFGLLFFGYTHCPDICPISMAVVTNAVAMLTAEEQAEVETVFVGVDFARDTPERVQEWLDALGSTAVGLVGSRQELEEALEPLRVHIASPVERQTHEGMGHDTYLIPHPTSVFLITPDGVGRFLYPYGRFTAAELVDDLRTLMALDW